MKEFVQLRDQIARQINGTRRKLARVALVLEGLRCSVSEAELGAAQAISNATARTEEAFREAQRIADEALMEVGIKISSTIAYGKTVIRQAYDELNAAQEVWYAKKEYSGEEDDAGEAEGEHDNAGGGDEEDAADEDEDDGKEDDGDDGHDG